MTTFMVFDVESIGLHGEGFAVGYVVIQNGHEIESGFYHCHPDLAEGRSEGREWIRENVEPHLSEFVRKTFSDRLFSNDPKAVRQRFWEAWERWKPNRAQLAADVPWPVEARFLLDCIADDPLSRAWSGPYPLLDIASIRFAKGLDPLAHTGRKLDETPEHHPLADARQSARLLLEALGQG